MFEKISYTGIGSAEFKLDEKDNQMKLIELNPRYWKQNSLSTICGMNVPYIEYLGQTSQSKFINGAKWINIYADYNAFLEYQRMGNLNFLGWIVSLKDKRTFSNFYWSDLKSWLYNLKMKFKLNKLLKLFRQLISIFT